MSSLDFLSPSRAAGTVDFHPLARSSMERAQRDAGATFEERDGWLVPVSIPGEDERLAHVGIADLSHLGKLEVRPNPGGQTPAGSVPSGDRPRSLGSDPLGSDPTGLDGREVWYGISPRRALVLCPTARTTALHDRLAATSDLVLDMTAGLSVLALHGPESPTLLRRLTHLHHFPSSGEVAHVTPVHVLERGGGYWLVFPQECGHHLWETAVDRAQPLGGGPAGVDALPEPAL